MTELRNSDPPFLGIVLVLAIALALLPPVAIPALLGSVVFFSLLKAGGGRFNLVVTLLLLQITSSTLDPALRLAVVSWSFLSLGWFGLVAVEDQEVTSQVPRGLITLVLFILFFMTISSLVSIGPEKALSATLRQTLFFVYAFLIYLNVREEKDVFLILSTLIVTGSLNALGIVIKIFTEGITAATLLAGPIRFYGIFSFINMNFAGTTIAFAAVITLSFFFIQKRGNRLARVLTGTFSTILFLAVLISNSRASMLAAMLALLVFVLIRYPRYRLPFVGGVAFVGAVLVLVPPVHEFILLMFRAENFLNIRDYLWGMSWAAIQDHYLLGTGPDLFKDYFFKYMTAPEGSYAHFMITKLYLEAGDSGLSHNFFIFRITELGIPGLMTAVWLPGLFYYYGIKTMKALKETDGAGYTIVTGIISIGTGLLARAMFESIGFLTHGWLMIDLPFWICFISLLFYYRKTVQIQTENRKNSPLHNKSASL